MQQPYYQHHYRDGRRLPHTWLEPPSRPPLEQEIRWLLRGWPAYAVDCWKRLWHLPHIDHRGRKRGFVHIRRRYKNGYAGVTLRRDGRAVWYSVRQLLQ